MTAFRGNPNHPDAESQRSNISTWEAALCPRQVTVQFSRLETGDLFGNDDDEDVGPLSAWFGAGDQSSDFESDLLLDASTRTNSLVTRFPRALFSVELGPEDSLYIGATITDLDTGGDDDTIFHWEEILSPRDIIQGEYRLTGRGSTVVVNIFVLEAHLPSTVSDRNLKSNIGEVNPRDVLTRLAQVPVSSWNYTSDGTAVRHIGVMAQDFYAAFGVGETDTRIMQVDADGVAFAAIQGLYQIVQERDAQIAALEHQNLTLEERIAALEQRLANQPLAAQPLPLEAFLLWLGICVAIGIVFTRAHH